MPVEVRREMPVVLQAIGTRAAQAVLIESILDGDAVLRYHIITALNKLGQQHPDRPIDRKLIETVLAAEIMGHYRSYQMLGTLGGSTGRARESVVHGLRESMEKEAERIFRLLKILYPDHDMHSAYVGLQSRRSDGARQRAGVPRSRAAAGTADADHPALRSRRAACASASRAPTGCSAPRSAIAKKRSR